MNPTAIYSKSGKGVQEAAGKTSLLKRPDRAVLAAIDGRATLADVAQKVGKPFDPGFQQLITQLDKDGFIREVSAGTASASAAPAAAAKPAPAAAKPAAKPAPADPASDLDFSSIGVGSKPAVAPAAPKPDPAAAARAKEQESALFKARQEAEAKAAADRERSEAKLRAETEARLRAETEGKLKAEAEAKAQVKAKAEAEEQIKAAREAAVRAAAEAKAKAETETKRAKEEAERARNEAEELRRRQEEAERSRKEAEEQARQAREEAERIRKEAEEERRLLEAERKREEEERAARRKREEEEEQARRKQREEQDRREEEERAARRKQREEDERREDEEKQAAKAAQAAKAQPEDEERAARRRREEEEEQALRKKRDEGRKQREEEERREQEERAARRKQREEEERREEEEKQAAKAKAKAKAKAEPEAEPEREAAKETKPKEAKKGGFAETLLADLASFTQRDDDERKVQEEADRKETAAKEEARQAREEIERNENQEAALRKYEEENERRRREEEEALRAREEQEKERLRDEEEKRKREAEERARKAKEEESRMAHAEKRAPGIGDDRAADLRRERALGGRGRRGRAAEVDLSAAPSKFRRPRKWGKPVATFLAVVLLIALAIAHVMPIKTEDFEHAASGALGRPVKIGSARLWLLTGLQIRFKNVTVGDGVSIAAVHAFPQITSLQEPRKAFSRVELERLKMPQQALGEALFTRLKSDNFSVARVIVNDLELTGPLALPKGIDVDLSLNPDGSLRIASLRGPEGLSARLMPRDATSIDFEMSASSFTPPIAPAIPLTQFSMKGSASRQGMAIAQWDGGMLNGTASGTANVRWGGNWTADGVITARGINAAVFAPALLSEGRGEGTGRFSMSGADPAKLASGGRVEGNFTITRGVLGSFDLSQAIRTSGRNVQGRTQFAEMHGQAVYNRGAVALRNVTIGAGALNAGASADIAQGGALSGRIVADVRTVSQTLSATLLLGGTVKEPQVKR